MLTNVMMELICAVNMGTEVLKIELLIYVTHLRDLFRHFLKDLVRIFQEHINVVVMLGFLKWVENVLTKMNVC